MIPTIHPKTISNITSEEFKKHFQNRKIYIIERDYDEKKHGMFSTTIPHIIKDDEYSISFSNTENFYYVSIWLTDIKKLDVSYYTPYTLNYSVRYDSLGNQISNEKIEFGHQFGDKFIATDLKDQPDIKKLISEIKKIIAPK